MAIPDLLHHVGRHIMRTRRKTAAWYAGLLQRNHTLILGQTLCSVKEEHLRNGVECSRSHGRIVTRALNPARAFGGIYMATKTARILGGLLLVVAGVLIGHGVGQMLSELTGMSEDGPRIIGLGLGLLAAVYIMVWKK